MQQQPMRAVVLALALVLVITAVPATGLVGASARAEEPEPVEPRGILRVCPEASDDEEGSADDDAGADADDDGEGAGSDPASDEPRFTDLDTPHAASILCAAEYGLVSGYPDGTFRPGEPITRAQMATFVAAWLRTATGTVLRTPDEPAFDDVAASVHGPAIEAIAAAGIVTGRADGRFDPEASLTRGQFTRAVANAISYADVFEIDGPLPPAVTEPVFTDVADTTFEATILALAGVGITSGLGDGRFDPTAPVTRGQLATFLLRAADYLDVYQRWAPTALEPVAYQGELIALLEALPDPDEPDDAGEGDGDDQGAGQEQDDGDEGAEPTPVEPRSIGEVTIAIDAFGGLLEGEVLVTELIGSTSQEARLELHRGAPEPGAQPVLVLAESLTPAGTATALEVFEAASRERFAMLIEADAPLVALLVTDDQPDGIAVATLEPAG